MDELQISGRRFISSRRIARDNGYHTDYIGQLIRGGKIKGQKVGRTWYVDVESFNVYLGQETPQEPAPLVQEIVEQKIEIKKVVEPVAVQAHYVPVASGGLRFVADEEPLLPEIYSKEVLTRVVPVAATASVPAKDQVEAIVFEHRPQRARIFFALGGLAVLIFIFSAVVSSTVFEKINIEAGNPASVGYSVGG